MSQVSISTPVPSPNTPTPPSPRPPHTWRAQSAPPPSPHGVFDSVLFGISDYYLGAPHKAPPPGHALRHTKSNNARTGQSPQVETHKRVGWRDAFRQPSAWLDQPRSMSGPMSGQSQARAPEQSWRIRSNTHPSVTWLGPSVASSRGVRGAGRRTPALPAECSQLARRVWATVPDGALRTPPCDYTRGPLPPGSNILRDYWLRRTPQQVPAMRLTRGCQRGSVKQAPTATGTWRAEARGDEVEPRTARCRPRQATMQPVGGSQSREGMTRITPADPCS